MPEPTTTTDLRVRLPGLDGDWLPLLGEQGSKAPHQALSRFLSDLLQSPDLLVLAGLGTSLCIEGAPTMSDLWSEATRLARFQEVCGEVGVDSTDGDIELLLSRCDMLAVIKPDSACAEFKRAAEALIFERCRFIPTPTSLPTHEEFLRRVARRSTRLQRTQIFTTNYDLAFETAASALGYLIVDGFSYTTPRTFDAGYFDYDFVRRNPSSATVDFVPEVFALHKLHGSVNWDGSALGVTQSENPTRPVLIFPRQSKYELSYELPFLESMGRFQSTLRAPNVGVLVVGCGLRDKHILEPLLGCLRSNPTVRMAVVDIAAQTSASPGFEAMRSIADHGDPRLALVNGTFAELARLLPDLAQRSEAERRDALVREILRRPEAPEAASQDE